MGAGSGGTSAVLAIINGETVSIPLPTDGSLVNSVLIYNYSPFLVQVTLGTSNAWLGAWMVDRFTLTNVSTVKCTATQVVGGAASTSTGSITAAFVLEGDDLKDVGTYPASLFHLSQTLEIVYPDGNPAVQIGPGQSIAMLDDATGNITSEWTPALTEWINKVNTGRIRVLPNGDPTTGNFPGIYFDTANAPNGYLNTAWIQANPDSIGNPQLGLNSGPFTDASNTHTARGRLFFASHTVELANIDVNTQAAIGGFIELWDNLSKLGYVDPVTLVKKSIYANNTHAFNAEIPILFDTWQNVSYQNGWSGNVQIRADTSGYTRFRGSAIPGTRTDGTTAFTLPSAGYAPASAELITPAMGLSGAYTGGQPRVQLSSDGTCQVFGLTTATANISMSSVFCDNPTWVA